MASPARTPDNIRDWIERLRAAGELHEITAEVDSDLEITEITDRVTKERGPALLFSNVRGYDMPVITNQFGSDRRLAMAFGVDDMDEIAERINAIFELAKPARTLTEKLSVAKQGAALAKSVPPKYVKRAPVQEVVHLGDAVDLDALPILKCWPEDGGRYITLPLVFSTDKHGVRNVGMYRVQQYDKNTCGMHWQIHKDAADDWRHMPADGRLEVAVAIGSEPIITYAASSPLPKDIDEMLFAGFARGRRVPMVQCKTVDVQVPAEAEIVIEGYVTQGELRTEGPFGDHTGYYSLADEYPVLHVTAVTHRRNPVYAATIVGVPDHEDKWMGKATERIFLPLLQMVQHEIVDYDLPSEGVFHGCCIVSIEKKFPAHAHKIMHAIWGTALLSLTKYVIVVDSEVDVHDYTAVAAAVRRNWTPVSDSHWSKGPLDVLDHAPTLMGVGGKLGLDATRPWPSEGRVGGPMAHVETDALEAWLEQREDVSKFNVVTESGLLIAAQSPDRPKDLDALATALSDNIGARGIKVMVLVDDSVDVDNLAAVAFRTFGNTDAVRDSRITGGKERFLALDATTKTEDDGYARDWPADIVMTEAIKQRVDDRWSEYGIPTAGARTTPIVGLAEGERRIAPDHTARGDLAGNADMVGDARG
jgi:4-hydroxy-3-polyprenylbenzoate decarboxylase